jgi:peptidoglycan hydrolase-like protein with peptidoglycan-binding domain
MVGHGLSLVNARYGNNSSGTIADVYAARGGDQGNGWQTYGGLSTVIWQYGSKVTWGNHQMDMNAYRGAPADLGQWFWTPPPPEPVPTPDPVPVPIPDPTPGVTVSNIAGPKRDLRIENRAALNADPLGVVDVQLCQILCNGLLNSGLKIDGDYGPKTTAAATAYQSFSRLKADGWWGAQTWSAVLNL